VRYLVAIGQDVESVHVGLVWEDAHWERQGRPQARTHVSGRADLCAVCNTPWV
jgi:hypothetical protein